MDVILFDEDMMVMLAEGHTLYEDGYDSTAKGQSLSKLLAGVADGHIDDVCRTALIGSHIQMESAYRDLTLYLEALPVKNESGETFAGLLLLHDITRIKKTENELKQRIEQLTTVRQVDDELSRNLSVDYVLDLVLDIAIRVSGARSAAVVLYADDFKVARSYGDELGESIKPELRQVMREGVGLNLGARMIVPLISLQRPLGAVVMLSKREFSEVAFNFMQILASRIAVALDNAQLFQMTQDQLAEIAAALRTCLRTRTA